VKHWGIVYADGAKGDILGSTDIISRDRNINADKALARLESRIGTLKTLPERGRVVPELHWHGITNIREVLENPWRIMSQVSAEEVVIIAVYDGRRQLNDVMMERFLR
jgi:toxin ParE1/3/4